MSEQFDRSPVDVSELVQELLAQPSEVYTLQRVVLLAVKMVPGCDLAGVSIRRGKRRVETPASTDPLVDELDACQYELDEGPCLDAIRDQDTLVIEDTGTDPRWPRWGPLAKSLGISSVLSVRLATADKVVGGLNLYARWTGAFDADAVQQAHRLAGPASTAVAIVEQMEGLRTAMQTRHGIGIAQGMLMLRYGLSEDQAFAFLARLSQARNAKLRDIAGEVAAELANNGWSPRA